MQTSFEFTAKLFISFDSTVEFLREAPLKSFNSPANMIFEKNLFIWQKNDVEDA